MAAIRFAAMPSHRSWWESFRNGVIFRKHFGNWKNVHRCFSRWIERGVWQRIFKHLSADADKAYDADGVIDTLKARNIQPVISPRRTRKVQRNYDKQIYKERNLAEWLFNKLKQFKDITTRYENLCHQFHGRRMPRSLNHPA